MKQAQHKQFKPGPIIVSGLNTQGRRCRHDVMRKSASTHRPALMMRALTEIIWGHTC